MREGYTRRMDYETILIAIVAVLLLARLWQVLGRKSEDDRQRPNPFSILVPGKHEDEGDAVFSPKHAQGDGADQLSTYRPARLAPASVEGGLEQIRTLDPSFDEKQFLQKARADFAAIIGDFAAGDMGPSEKILGAKVLAMFRASLDARREAAETMKTRIAKIAEAETKAVRLEDTRAFVTVRFVSEQENILRDKEGRVIGGTEGRLEEVTDVWVFARDLKDAQSLWQLVETHG